MPRIRTIKPEYWSSPGTETISPWARLLFVAMWNWADDAGRGTCQLKELQGFAFPLDEEETAPEVATMAGFKRTLAQVREQYDVVFYKVSGRPYYAIPSWKRHQRNERTAQSKYPAPEEGEKWDFLPSDQRSSGTSDMFRPTVAEDSTASSESVGSGPGNVSGISEPRPPLAGVPNPENNPNTPGELDSGGTSDTLRHGVAEAPQTSGPGTGEQGNRGTGEVTTSASPKHIADALSDDPAFFGDTKTPKAKRKPKQDPPLFVAFWNHYPKKTDKPGARRAFKRAIEDGVDAGDIITGAKLYGQMWEGATTEELHWAVKSSKWLADEMWNGSWPMRDTHRANNVVEMSSRNRGGAFDPNILTPETARKAMTEGINI